MCLDRLSGIEDNREQQIVKVSFIIVFRFNVALVLWINNTTSCKRLLSYFWIKAMIVS